jgi:hypothetical protein
VARGWGAGKLLRHEQVKDALTACTITHSLRHEQVGAEAEACRRPLTLPARRPPVVLLRCGEQRAQAELARQIAEGEGEGEGEGGGLECESEPLSGLDWQPQGAPPPPSRSASASLSRSPADFQTGAGLRSALVAVVDVGGLRCLCMAAPRVQRVQREEREEKEGREGREGREHGNGTGRAASDTPPLLHPRPRPGAPLPLPAGPQWAPSGAVARRLVPPAAGAAEGFVYAFGTPSLLPADPSLQGGASGFREGRGRRNAVSGFLVPADCRLPLQVRN